MSENKKSYNQGMIDGLELYGRVCGKTGNCLDCPIGNIRGANVTCQDFAKQFPAKMLSLLKEMDKGEITYYEEYCMRFPDNQMPIDIFASCMCRKAIFEGYLDCPVADSEDDDALVTEKCLACWNEKYIGDKTEDDPDISDKSDDTSTDII